MIFFESLFEFFFLEKNALNQEMHLFSAVCKPHYTGDGSNWIGTNQGISVLMSNADLCFCD